MTFTVKIKCDNAAFDPAGTEIARMLTVIATKLDGMSEETLLANEYSPLYDINGNKVGEARWKK